MSVQDVWTWSVEKIIEKTYRIVEHSRCLAHSTKPVYGFSNLFMDWSYSNRNRRAHVRYICGCKRTFETAELEKLLVDLDDDVDSLCEWMPPAKPTLRMKRRGVRVRW